MRDASAFRALEKPANPPSLEGLMTKPTHSYPDRPIRPELIRNANLLTVFLEADPAAVGARLPSGLSPRPDGRVVLNVWSHDDPNQMTGFGGLGPMSVCYLAVEVAGQDGASADGSVHFPGRFWVHHWSSSDRARAYALAASGLLISPGETTVEIVDDRFIARLVVDGRTQIAASARIGRQMLGTMSGYSIYYAERDNGEGGAEVAQFEVPWVSDAFDAESASVEFLFEDGAAPWRLVGNRQPTVLGVSYRRITLVPYLAQRTIVAAV